MYMKTIIVWTYTSKEEEIFASKKTIVGRWLNAENKDLQLIIYKQKCIEFKKENNRTKIAFVKKQYDLNCPDRVGIEDLEIGKDVVLFHHNWREIPGHEFIPAEVSILDYSSTDEPFYTEMKSDIQKAEDERAFILTAQKWIRFYFDHYRREPIRLIKSRVLNLLAPRHITLQHIQHLLLEKEFDKAEKIFKEVVEKGERINSLSHLSSSDLIKLWYFILGDALNWEGIKIVPPQDVYLPEDRNKEGKPLYFWIKSYLSDVSFQQLDAWQILLRISGLQQQTDNFSINTFSCVLNFEKIFETIAYSKNTHDWLKAITNLAERNRTKNPLDFLWGILYKAEIENRNVSELFQRDLTYQGIWSHLSEFRFPSDEIIIVNNFFSWYQELSSVFDKIQNMGFR